MARWTPATLPDRLPAKLIASAIIRSVNTAGGFATILAKGDESGGSIIIVLAEKGQVSGVFERVLGLGGVYAWMPVGPQDVDEPGLIQHYIDQRRQNDPDLWLIELDTPDPARFIAQLSAFY